MKPAATGPTTLDSDGAMPSQLNRRTRSVLLRAAWAARRWMTISPMLAPLPTNTADRHNSAKCGVSSTKVEATASNAPKVDRPMAMRTGRW